jgi:hypothetical protein
MDAAVGNGADRRDWGVVVVHDSDGPGSMNGASEAGSVLNAGCGVALAGAMDISPSLAETNGVPHIPQKRKSYGLTNWHDGQVRTKGAPHRPQNFMPGGLSKPHL